MTVVEATGLRKTFGAGHTSVTAVDDVSLTIEAGDIVLVMGPSGSGKTTLISMIGTLMRPTAGSILIGGRDLGELNDRELARLRLRDFGFVFQTFNLLSALTSVENAMMPLLIAGMSRCRARDRASRLLRTMRLGDRLESLPRDLSGGEKQRVAIARALVNDPKLILADEPTANLDSVTGSEVTRLLCEIACKENRAVVIVSHDSRLRAFAKRVITIADGRLMLEEDGDHDENCSLHSPRPEVTGMQ